MARHSKWAKVKTFKGAIDARPRELLEDHDGVKEVFTNAE